MTTLMSLNGPFEMGLKPKSYFQGAKELAQSKVIRSSAMIKGRAFDASKVKKEYKNSDSSESLAESNISKNHIEVDTTKTKESFSEVTKTASKVKRDSTAIVRVGYLLLTMVIIGYGVVRKYFPSIFVKVKQFIKL